MFPGMGGSMPSTSMMFQYYASFTGLMMMITTAINTYVPYQVRVYIVSLARRIFFGKKVAPNNLTLAINEFQGVGGVHNQVFEAAETFLNTKISPTMKGLELSKSAKDKRVNISVNKRSQFIEDEYEGIKLIWTLVGGFSSSSSSASTNPLRMRQPMHRSASDVFFQDPGEGTDESPTRFELSFDEKHYEKVVESYIPYILKKAKELNDVNTTLKLWSSGGSDMYGHSSGGGARGGSVNLQHPSTFQTLALDPELKREIIDDLDRFVKRRDFYTKVGKAWKRGYLLDGPPGTGKSSLVAAMANYLNFDVYDLELTNIRSNSQLRSVLLGTKNRSILLIEDIDCSAEMHDRSKVEHQYDEYGRPFPAKARNTELTLSGLLNFIDGIWSSCGDERIIIFTTNHKDKLDPALLRPGRMDKHIHMSYITPPGFRILASNYLSVDEHHLFGEIDELIQESQTTPAEVAEELMKSDDTEVSLNGLIQFLKRKIPEAKQLKEEEEAQKKLKEEEAQKELKEEIDQKETKDGEPKRTQISDRYCSKCGTSKPLRRMGGLN